MEARLKAKELIDNFYKHVHECNNSDAKQCALIAVDEIIKAIPCREDYGGDGWVLIENTDYWEEVKQNLENL